MKYDNVLKKIENGEINANEAYKELYPIKKMKPGKRATFVKMNMTIPEEGKGINTFLKLLFLIPFPLIFARIGLRFAGRFAKFDDDIDISEISHLLKYSKNTKIDIDTDDAKVQIKII